MNQIESYIIPDLSNKKFDIQVENGNRQLIECSYNERKYYMSKIKEYKKSILLNCHKSIRKYINNDNNIFNGKFKFSKIPIIPENDIYMGMKALYKTKYIILEIFLLNELPHIMFNNEVYPNFNFVNYDNKNVIECCKCNKKLLNFLLLGHKSLIKFQQIFRRKLHKKKFNISLNILKCSPEYQIEYNYYPSFKGGSDYLICKNSYTLGLCIY